MLTKVKTTSKKAFSILLAFVMCFTAFAICMPVIAEAATNANNFYYGRYYYYPQGTRFISAFAVEGASNKDDVLNWFNNNGYTRHETDLNTGAGGNYIYIGYKTTTDINQAAATYIRVKHEGAENLNPSNANFTVNNKSVTFTGMGNGSGVYDVNQGSKKTDYTYIYYSNDPSLGLPITAISVTESSATSSGFLTAQADDSGAASDLNSKNDNSSRGGEDSNFPTLYLHFGNYDEYTDVTDQMLRMLEAIETSKTLGDQNCYTAASWYAYSTALAEANRIAGAYNNKYNAGTVEASKITAAAAALEKAMAGLQTVIKIDANGGVSSATEYTVLAGDKATISFPARSYTATKEGHTFLGWNTDKNATTGSKTTLNVPVGGTVYAIFSINKFTVNFYNTVTKETVKTETVDYKANATAPNVTQIIKNNADTHYKFNGWDKGFSNITESITVNTIYVLEDHTFELINETEATCNKTGSKVYVCSDCGETKTETAPIVPDKHVNKTEYPAKASTCNVAGYTAYTYCNDCHNIISGKDPLPLADHTWGDWSTSTATCTQDGTSTRKCSVCNTTETKPVSATGHSWGDWETTKDATCTSNGREQRQCSACKETETKIINSTGHSYKAVVTDPTCTETGFTTHSCSVCGDTYIDSYVDALDHDWQNVDAPTVEATCTTSGVQNQKCLRCPETRVATVEALGHDWQNKTISKEPTCTENGIMSATCDRCKETQTAIIIPALGHAWDDGIITTEPTCTTAGNLHKTCGTCGEERDIVLNALDHAWDDGTVTKEPTCTSEGSKYFECGRCDVTKTEKIPTLPHAYKGVVTFPTCTEGGYTTYTCADCGDVFVDDITDALGHADIVTVVPPTCTQQGYTATRCLVCNRITRTDYVPATGHSSEDIVVPPTCTDKGYTLHQCSICYEGTKDTYVDPLGHEYSTATVAPTCTQKGYDLHTCIRGDHSKMDNYVDALGHNHTEVDRIEPTKTHNGYVLYVCDVCANEKKEVLYYDGKALVYITLYDTEGNPVKEATITFTEVNTGETFILKTDLNGYFTEVLPQGNYKLIISKVGYKDTEGSILVEAGKATIDIPEIPFVDECDCYCHKTDFISAIRRIIAKILAIFGIKHDCCEHSEV